ncbi:MAG: PQQ-binding-like beta-propeller repeat protein [Thermoanaerobaculia bacterium]|nr:PQQ-binding-like beta-propeller repeat protein [Thermoanaerobaculia bacterium]
MRPLGPSSNAIAPLAALGLLVTVAACGGGAGAPPADPGEWPRFRGPGGNGVTEATGLPVEWSADSPNVRWRTEIPGIGNSSPIVSHGRVFLTTAVDTGERQLSRRVVALDLDSGGILWQREVTAGEEEQKHPLNTSAAPTPVTDGRVVYAHFGDVLVALDREGEELWSTVIDPDYLEFSHYGAGSSPVLTEKAVIVAQDRETGEKAAGWIGAFDRRTGRELWRESWTDRCCSYTTPLIRDRGAGEEIIFPQQGMIVAYAAEDGRTLWTHELVVNQPVASPVTPEPDLLVFLSGANQVRVAQAIRLTGAGSETRPEALWQATRVVPQTSSPVVYQGLLYSTTDAGGMVARPVDDLNPFYTRRLPSTAYESSLVAGDGKVYANNMRGETAVVRAGSRFELLALNSLGERGSNASPAVAGSSLLIRTRRGLFRIDGPGPQGAEPAGG